MTFFDLYVLQSEVRVCLGKLAELHATGETHSPFTDYNAIDWSFERGGSSPHRLTDEVTIDAGARAGLPVEFAGRRRIAAGVLDVLQFGAWVDGVVRAQDASWYVAYPALRAFVAACLCGESLATLRRLEFVTRSLLDSYSSSEWWWSPTPADGLLAKAIVPAVLPAILPAFGAINNEPEP